MNAAVQEKLARVGGTYVGGPVRVVESASDYAELIVGTIATLVQIDDGDPIATYKVAYDEKQWEAV